MSFEGKPGIMMNPYLVEDVGYVEDFGEVEPEIEEKVQDRKKGAEFHKVYFEKTQIDFIEAVQDATKVSFGDAVRAIVEHDKAGWDIFTRMQDGEYLVIDRDGNHEVVAVAAEQEDVSYG